MSVKLPELAVVIPCYNEEQALEHTWREMAGLLESLRENRVIAENSFILFVDDGSVDATWSIIERMCSEQAQTRGLKLAGNYGHQNALMAGMMAVKDQVDCVVTIDADLQDELAVIPKMLEECRAGCHVVYGVRSDRSADTWFKRTTANGFYRLMSFLGAKSIPGHADYRLLDSFALECLSKVSEQNLFLRSIIPSLGLRSACVYYARKPRAHGETKYPLRKMITFALRGIIMSSPAPLRLAGILSLVTFMLALLQSLLAWKAYLNGSAIPGWTSLILAILYLGSIQLFCLALIGEYLARVFTEVKGRPRYIVEREID